MRDPESYSSDEVRVAKWISAKGIGGGDDPIGFVLSSYDYIVYERNRANEALRQILAIENEETCGGDVEEIIKAQVIAAAALGEGNDP